jgi:hypothetical protein
MFAGNFLKIIERAPDGRSRMDRFLPVLFCDVDILRRPVTVMFWPEKICEIRTDFEKICEICTVSLSDGDILIGPCRLQRPRTTTGNS